MEGSALFRTGLSWMSGWTDKLATPGMDPNKTYNLPRTYPLTRGIRYLLLGVPTRAILAVIGPSSNPSLYKWFGLQGSKSFQPTNCTMSPSRREGAWMRLCQGAMLNMLHLAQSAILAFCTSSLERQTFTSLGLICFTRLDFFPWSHHHFHCWCSMDPGWAS